jgi:predicted O-linked N-acetylglucosamine transferase (SPINDLY family)
MDLRPALEALRGGRPAEARAHCEALLQTGAGGAALSTLHAVTLAATGEHARADRVLADVLLHAPGHMPAWLERGRLALARGDAVLAEACFAHAQRLAPNDARALVGLGEAAEALGKHDAELWVRQRLLQLEPGSVLRLAQLGDALRRDERAEQAAQAFDGALARAPDDVLLRWLRLNTLRVVPPDLAAVEAERRGWSDGLAALEQLPLERNLQPAQALAVLSSATNFYRHYLGEPLLDDQRRYAAVLRRLARIALPRFDQPLPAARGPRRRVGFVSSHFHQHTVAKLFGAWLGALDRARFEVYAFHLDPHEDATTARLRGTVEHFVGAHADVARAAEAIRDARLDALIHLDLGMHPHQQALSALRLAPLQALTWGHPITSGLPTIDAFLTGAAMEPADGERHYTETLVRLPRLGIAYAQPDTAPDPGLHLPLPGGSLGYVFCAQSAQKLHPGHDAWFAELAAACPRHPLVLIPHDKAHVREALAARMKRAYAARGLAYEQHVVMLPHVTLAQFLALCRGAELVLDSLDWSGGNSTLEALAVDAPVLSVPGTTMRSRHTAAMLELLELPELIAADAAGAVAGAAALLGDAPHRRALRAAIAERKHALYDDPAPLRALGAWLEGAIEERAR